MRHHRKSARRGEQGYVLLTMLLFFTLLAIAMTVTAPDMIFQLKRDREEEMIHRGTQYSRSIRWFVKKIGRYPARLEELDNTNQIRFIRKHYKDPITGKDFKLLHQSDVQLGLGGPVALNGGVSAAQLAQGAQGLQALAQSGQLGAQGQALLSQANQAFGQSSFGQSSFGQSSFGQSSFGQSSFGQNSSQSSFQSSGAQNAFGDTSSDNSTAQPVRGLSGPSGPGTQSTTGENLQSPDSSQSTGNSNGTTGTNGNSNGQTGFGAGQGFGNAGSNQQFGGGAIVGVASLSKEKSIREFNKKNHYDKWQFIYDPTMDRGGLITTPAQPPLQVSAPNVNGQPGQNGQNGQPGVGNSSFGNSSFGNSGGGFNNNNSSFGNSGFSNQGGFNNNSGFGNSGSSNQNQQPSQQ
jgi:hypothetical protein